MIFSTKGRVVLLFVSLFKFNEKYISIGADKIQKGKTNFNDHDPELVKLGIHSTCGTCFMIS